MRTIAAALGLLSTLGLAAAGCSSASTGDQSANATEATVHHFECETQNAFYDGVVHSVSFSIRSLERPAELDFVYPEDEDEYWITVAPEESRLFGLMENGIAFAEDGKLVLEGDSDGFYWSKLVLYENSGFTRGYVSLEDGGDYIGGDQYSTISCTVTEQKPSYSLADAHLLGSYSTGDSDYCPGGFSACEYADITQLESGQWEIDLGSGDYWEGYKATLVEANGVLVFSTGDRYEYGGDFDDCDDPGCGNMLHISGVVYPKKIDGQWVPTVKAHYTIEFPFPDEPEAPEGIVKHRSHMTQQQAD